MPILDVIILDNGKKKTTEFDTDIVEAGWHNVPLSKVVKVSCDNVVITSKFEKQSGYIKHCGFIKGIG